MTFTLFDLSESAKSDQEAGASKHATSEVDEHVENLGAPGTPVLDEAGQNTVDCQLGDVCVNAEQLADADNASGETKTDDSIDTPLADKSEQEHEMRQKDSDDGTTEEANAVDTTASELLVKDFEDSLSKTDKLRQEEYNLDSMPEVESNAEQEQTQVHYFQIDRLFMFPLISSMTSLIVSYQCSAEEFCSSSCSCMEAFNVDL